MIHLGVLGLLQPVMLEDVLREPIQGAVVLERREVVQLREPLDGGGQQERGARALAENGPGHRLLLPDEGKGKTDRLVHQRADLTEEVHVLHLFRGEIDEGIEGHAVVDREVLCEAHHLGRDELLDVAEEVRIGSHLHVSELRLLVLGQTRDPRRAREL